MSDLELNKIAAAFLVAGLVAIFTSNLSDILYKPQYNLAKRGYEISVSDQETSNNSANDAPAEKVDLASLLASANSDNGKNLVKKCTMCHSFDKGGARKIGPNLWDIVDNKKGHDEGFAYSQSLLAKGGKWSYDDLYHFINNPRAFISGTKMSFAGIKKPQEIADILAYLKTLSDSPKEFPK